MMVIVTTMTSGIVVFAAIVKVIAPAVVAMTAMAYIAPQYLDPPP